jgi:Protein of unknown function (DUF3618)
MPASLRDHRQREYEAHHRRDKPMTTQELEQEIERTREHLGATLDELAGQADLRARAKARAADVSSRVLRRRWPLVVAAGVLIAGSVIIRRRGRRA